MDIISLKYPLAALLSVFIYYQVGQGYRIFWLILISCGFIATFSIYLLLHVLAFTVINYLIGRGIRDSRSGKAFYIAGILINLSQLVVLKYSPFIIDPFFHIFNSDITASVFSEFINPVGVSYFTLQGIGYLINIKMGWEKPEKQLRNLFLYFTFFPKYLSGPIERSNHFLPQLGKVTSFSEVKVVEGLRIALFGFFKKVAVADQLSGFISHAFANLQTADSYSLWIVLLLLPLYLYFDFSGYTDIAIGFARMFGIDLLPNFNRPFFSENMTTFWKRFHISLSSWFNDYIFRQASFRYRKLGVYASVIGLLLTWILFGIWHGAGWNFLILGFVQALAIIYEFFTKKWRIRIFSWMPAYPRTIISRIITFVFYGGSLVFFFSPDINSSLLFFKQLVNGTGSVGNLMPGHMRALTISWVIITIVMAIELLQNDFAHVYSRIVLFWHGNQKWSMRLRHATYYVMFALIFVLYKEIQQFIYFQF